MYSINERIDKPLRILHVLGSMNHGGIQSFLMNIYRKIDHTKIQFDFIIHTEQECVFNEEIRNLGGQIYYCPKYSGENHFTYRKWWENFFVERKDYKIIHGHMRSTATIYLEIAKRNGLQTISHSHSTSSGRGLGALVKNIMQLPIRRKADYLFACSKAAGRWLFGEKSLNKNNFHIVNNAIEAEKYTFNAEIRNRARDELCLSEDEFIIGHVGRFITQKNHYFLIDIFNIVQSKLKNAKLLLVGDGELRANIEDYINKKQLNDKVILLGTRSDVANLMQAMDIFVLPSINEGLGIVSIEAQAAGLVCITSDTIPEETFITNLIRIVSLKDSPNTWADTIISYSEKVIRKNTLNEIKAAKYDVKDTTKWLEQFYLNVVKK